MRLALTASLVLTGLIVMALVVDATTAMVFLMTVGKSLQSFEPGITLQLWQSYGLDPVYRTRLTKSLFSVGFTMSVGIAMFMLMLRKASNLHGNAKFATVQELRREGLLGEKGIVFGKVGSRYLHLPGQRHVIAVAPTRSGKTTGIAIPNLLNWPDSVVVLDMKLELFARTSGFRASHGHDVFLFAPFAQDFRTNQWNPLDGVRRGNARQSVFTVQDLMGIATVLYPAREGDATSQFFANQAQNLFLGVALLVLETPGMPFTFGQVLRVRSISFDGGFPAYLQHVLQTRTDLSEGCCGAVQQFLGATGDTLSSILATFDAPLLIFRNPLVDAATSRSDFRLSELRRRRTSVYLGVSPRDLEMGSVLMTLFISQTLYQNLDTLPEQDPTLRFQLLLLLDEFRVLGKMSVLVDAAGYLAGYGVRLLTIIQSTGQLAIYGKEQARAFTTNHGCKIVYAPRDESDAREISEALGTFTEMSESYSRSGRPGKFLTDPSSTSAGVNVSAQRRALMLPQEVKQLPFREEIVFLEGLPPIRARKAYFGDAVWQSRVYPPISITPLDVIGGQEAQPSGAAERRFVQASGPAVDPVSNNAASLEGRLDNLVMRCVDRENPTQDEVKAFVDDFMQGLEQLGAWR